MLTLADRMTEFVQSQFTDERWSPNVEVNFNSRCHTSQGGLHLGSPWLSIACGPFMTPGGDMRWDEPAMRLEYDHIAKDREIGSMIGRSKIEVLSGVIAHEMSHAVQYTLSSAVRPEVLAPDFSGYRTKDEQHGLIWQSIYRALRVRFVNGQDFHAVLDTAAAVKAAKMKKLEERFARNATLVAIGTIEVPFVHTYRVEGYVHISEANSWPMVAEWRRSSTGRGRNDDQMGFIRIVPKPGHVARIYMTLDDYNRCVVVE